MTMNYRGEFEKLFPVPLGVKWCERQQDYTYENYRNLYAAASYSSWWKVWQAALAQAVPNEHGKNRYGLDMAYFRNLFIRELNRPLVDFRPDELARVLARAARTADADVLREPEFQGDMEPSGVWQFYQDGEWHTGMNTNNHRKNTEAAGFPTRDLYARSHPTQRGSVPEG